MHKYTDVLTTMTEPYTPPLTANILSRVGNLISSNAPFSGSFSSVKLQYPIHSNFVCSVYIFQFIHMYLSMMQSNFKFPDG